MKSGAIADIILSFGLIIGAINCFLLARWLGKTCTRILRLEHRVFVLEHEKRFPWVTEDAQWQEFKDDFEKRYPR